MKIGDTQKGGDIHGRNMQLFTEPVYIAWAIETHARMAPILGLAKDNVTGIIIIGNEDTPDQIWATRDKTPNHLETEYTLIYLPPKAVRCAICGMLVAPSMDYGSLDISIPGNHAPQSNPDNPRFAMPHDDPVCKGSEMLGEVVFTPEG